MVFDVDLEIKEDLAVLYKQFDNMDRFLRYFCSIQVLSFKLILFLFHIWAFQRN